MAVSSTETELKYDVPEGAVVPELDQLPAVSRTRKARDEQLEAEYYDTEDLRLIRAGITLRRRRGGHDEGWHLKIPAGDNSRREIAVPLGDGDEGVPDELAERIRVHTRGKPVRPRATITTERKRLILIGDSGAALAELAMDEVHAQKRTKAKSEASWPRTTWREVELELTGGDRDLLDAADRLLRKHGLQRAASSAKFERVVGAGPRRAHGHRRPTSGSSASAVVVGYVADQVTAIASLDPMVRRNEPDAVHQMRVATRRIRSTLQSFGKLVWTSDTSHAAAELKWLGGLLGQARDAEVLTERLLGRLGRLDRELVIGPVPDRVRDRFSPAGTKAIQAVRKGLDSRRYFALLDELDELIREPELTDDAGELATSLLPGAARRAYRRTRRRMRVARKASAGSERDVALHEARKAAKRARYAAELIAPVIGSDARRFARRMKRVQTLLGDHQDSVIARRLERELAVSAARAGENAFTYGVLYERDVESAERAEAKAVRAWKRAARPGVRSWMR